MFRWYDYWIKGIDNGVMDEPSVSVFVEGSRERVTAGQWPPKDVGYKSLYLRPRGKLFPESEPMAAEYAAHIFAEIDQTDTNFIMRLWDYAPDGKRQLITSGYLKPSHRELDERTTEATRSTRTPVLCRWNPGRSRSTCCASTRSRIRSCRASNWWWSSRTTSRWRTSTTRCSRRTRSTCRWPGPSPTRSTATPDPGQSARIW